MGKRGPASTGKYVDGKEVPEHWVWRTMLRREDGKDGDTSYKGIMVCDRWRTYENFIADMGPRPSPLHQLDRVTNTGNYEPTNCRWATRSVQQKNKRTTRRWSFNGTDYTLVEAAALVGISKSLALWRIKNWGTFKRGMLWLSHQKAA